MFDRFAICQAYYCYFVLYHGGQGSREYQRLSKMTGYFKPGLGGGDNPDNLEEDAREIFDAIVEREGHEPYRSGEYDTNALIRWCEKHDGYATEEWLDLVLRGKIDREGFMQAVADDTEPEVGE